MYLFFDESVPSCVTSLYQTCCPYLVSERKERKGGDNNMRLSQKRF